MSDRRKHPIIVERSETNLTETRRTSRARKYLYDLIAMFRRDAAISDDQSTKNIFEHAADVVADLARAFRSHEDDLADREQSDNLKDT